MMWVFPRPRNQVRRWSQVVLAPHAPFSRIPPAKHTLYGSHAWPCSDSGRLPGVKDVMLCQSRRSRLLQLGMGHGQHQPLLRWTSLPVKPSWDPPTPRRSLTLDLGLVMDTIGEDDFQSPLLHVFVIEREAQARSARACSRAQ